MGRSAVKENDMTAPAFEDYLLDRQQQAWYDFEKHELSSFIEDEVEKAIEKHATFCWELYSHGDPMYMSREQARRAHGKEIARKTREELHEINYEMFWGDFPYEDFEKQVREDYNHEFDIEEDEQ